jgi:hypothetical protein
LEKWVKGVDKIIARDMANFNADTDAAGLVSPTKASAGSTPKHSKGQRSFADVDDSGGTTANPSLRYSLLVLLVLLLFGIGAHQLVSKPPGGDSNLAAPPFKLLDTYAETVKAQLRNLQAGGTAAQKGGHAVDPRVDPAEMYAPTISIPFPVNGSHLKVS